MRYPENVQAVSALQPDYLGFIFYGKSPRFAGMPAAGMLEEIPPNIGKVAVFVDAEKHEVEDLIARYKFSTVQLHGSESREFCLELKKHVGVVKAFGIDENFDFNTLEHYADAVDYFLFDTKTVKHGGSGDTFNWKLLDRYTLDVPFFVSGGLSPDNIGEVMGITHPQFYGVDLNSRFEAEPGLKAVDKLEKAFNIIKQTTDELRS